MMTDPIADLLTRIRNAQTAAKISVNVDLAKMKRAVLEVLKEEGYIEGYSMGEVNGKPVIDIKLGYRHGEPVISDIRRVSRPGLRVYRGADDLPTVNGGLGIAVISTSRGVMTDRAARKAEIGGEVVCTVN
ncbi:MAG: 30S ribosomal protein S8 [Gammaproteobacteria bacterium]|nr:30S ribosomal protein S8 [Gammaproteobacteria bacterium]